MSLKYYYFSILFMIIMHFSVNAQPLDNGFVVYHSYTSYDAWNSKMYLLDLEENNIIEIGRDWNIDHEMNGHISPDGTKLVFMGDDKGEPRDWDIYLWEIGSSDQPINLTHGYDRRDEDPKFSPDGTKIVFKQAYWSSSVNGFIFDIKELDLSGNIINTVTSYNQVEESMPYYTADGLKIIYASSGGADGDIYSIDQDGSNNSIIESQSSVQEYYPIVRDSETYFFTRWVSASDHHDQVYIGNFNGDPAVKAAFNVSTADYSDAYPAGGDLAFFSSTRSGGRGAYDLYIGDVSTGEVWNMDTFGSINTYRNELGACYNENSYEDLLSNEIIQKQVGSVYPNPGSDGIFNLKIDKEYQLSVISIDGKLIVERQVSDGEIVDLSTQDRGIYFFVLKSKEELQALKVLIR
ncbi:MAG: T9SS type A sorting domain-containing protein [Bacteroidota bacterium]